MPGSTTDLETLASRLDAVERALTDGASSATRPSDADPDAATGPAVSGPGTPDDEPTAAAETTGDRPTGVSDRSGATDRRIANLEATVSDLEDSVADLSAELDAVRGLLGGVRAVNESVERRADLALAVAEELATDEAEELVVERLPEVDAAELGVDSADDDEAESDSLAARLREAL